MSLSSNAMAVLERRYIRKDEIGQPMETVEGMFHRVAYHVAGAHTEPGAEHDALTAVYENMMSSLEFLPNTPTFTGAGTPLGQLAACFVLPIDDDIGKDSKAGIFSTLRNAALIQQSGGGVGFSFSRLRHKGDRVQKSAGVASGPVSFLKVYDVALSSVTQVEPQSAYKIGENVIGAAPVDFQVAKGPIEFMTVYNSAFSAIAQGGTRRGASMGVLRVDHPDIMEFIACKSNQSDLNGFNISVGITDAFMRAYLNHDLYFDLISPRTGQKVDQIFTQDLMDKIVENAHRNGEPGVLFLDTINRRNPLPHLYKIETTNPCGKSPIIFAFIFFILLHCFLFCCYVIAAFSSVSRATEF
jgi:ribonucleoside-diphosphate reductase alpha chain